MSPDFPRQYVTLPSGMTLAYMEAGQGAPILWIHGMGAYRETFHHLFEERPVPGRYLALDLPGFGHSSHLPRRHRLADYAEATIGFLDAMALPRATLVGHSFGGMVAGETVARFPGRVAGVLFVSSAGWCAPENALSPTPYEWMNRIGIWITGMDFFGARMMKALGVNPDTLSRDDRRRFQWGWRHAYEMARMGTFYESPDFCDRVVASGRPVAAIHGSQDLLFPVDRVEAAITRRFPLKVIDGAGHVPFLSHPESFMTALRECFQHLCPGPRNDSP